MNFKHGDVRSTYNMEEVPDAVWEAENDRGDRGSNTNLWRKSNLLTSEPMMRKDAHDKHRGRRRETSQTRTSPEHPL